MTSVLRCSDRRRASGSEPIAQHDESPSTARTVALTSSATGAAAALLGGGEDLRPDPADGRGVECGGTLRRLGGCGGDAAAAERGGRREHGAPCGRSGGGQVAVDRHAARSRAGRARVAGGRAAGGSTARSSPRSPAAAARRRRPAQRRRGARLGAAPPRPHRGRCRRRESRRLGAAAPARETAAGSACVAGRDREPARSEPRFAPVTRPRAGRRRVNVRRAAADSVAPGAGRRRRRGLPVRHRRRRDRARRSIRSSRSSSAGSDAVAAGSSMRAHSSSSSSRGAVAPRISIRPACRISP